MATKRFNFARFSAGNPSLSAIIVNKCTRPESTNRSFGSPLSSFLLRDMFRRERSKHRKNRGNRPVLINNSSVARAIGIFGQTRHRDTGHRYSFPLADSVIEESHKLIAIALPRVRKRVYANVHADEIHLRLGSPLIVNSVQIQQRGVILDFKAKILFGFRNFAFTSRDTNASISIFESHFPRFLFYFH